MSYYDIISGYKDNGRIDIFKSVSEGALKKSIYASEATVDQFACLLSQEAENSLEEMARRSHGLTLRYFGRTIQLYTPLYLSNYCDNECIYCGFNSGNDLKREKLSLAEVENEARRVSSTGLKHILVLTGESRKESPVSYIKDCVKILRKYFSSISVEFHARTEGEYA